jgi:hypothetical protein
MIRKVKLTFYGPDKIEGDREAINKMFLAVLDKFLQEKGITEAKLKGVEYIDRVFTGIIGTYLYRGLAEVEYREGG